jgi:hypothetical protein
LPSIPSKQLLSWLPLYLNRTDATISHLNRILSTPSGIDVVLMLISYSSKAASEILSTISLARLRETVSTLIAAAEQLPPNTTILIETNDLPPSRVVRSAASLKALSGLISDFRIFARLWGLLGMWSWGKGVLKSPPKDVLLRRIAYAQVLVNVVFQYFENGAYLASKGVLGWSGKKQTQAWLWSSRAWAAHVGLEFVRLGRVVALKRRRGVDEKEKEKEEGEGEKEWWEGWRKELLINGAYAPLTVHWSLEQGLLGELSVGLLGTLVGVVNLSTLWKRTA